jgi:Asp-tRNA(Asn)/Glu-tRNA(Gln) amidotransferase A subunit family amidase
MRRGGLQANVRSGEPVRDDSLCMVFGSRRTPGAHGGRRGADPARDRQAGFPRLCLGSVERRDACPRTGPRPAWASCRGAQGVRFRSAGPRVAAAFREALDTLGRLGVDIGEASVPLLRYAIPVSTAIQSVEVAAYHEQHYRTRSDEYGEDIRARLALGARVRGVDYVKAQRIRHQLIDQFSGVFRAWDALVCPMVPVPAPGRTEEVLSFNGCEEARGDALVRYTRAFNLVGAPAVSVPAGFTASGLPVAFQLAAAPFRDHALLGLVHAYQQHTKWHLAVPSAACGPDSS